MPVPGNAAARTALPQPPSTSQNVPTNSAPSFFESGMCPPWFREPETFAEPGTPHGPDMSPDSRPLWE